MSSSLDSHRIERVMLDLETGGTDPGCTVYTIGACTFDLMERFYERISPASVRMYLSDDIETMRWWYKQDRQLMEEAFSGTQELVAVLDKFHDWFRKLNSGDYKHTEIWCKGGDFDAPILKAAYKVVGRPVPWHEKKVHCFRTLQDLLPAVKAPPRASRWHHALDDAIYQAEHARLLLQVL